MNTKFTIKNFRCFDSNGVTVDLRPITLLTGCNSSGKSSIVKGLLLLSNYFQELKDDKGTGDSFHSFAPLHHIIDFTKRPNNLLGNFSKVVNIRSGEKIVTMILRVHSGIIEQDVDIEVELKKDPKDNLNNGCVHSIKLKLLDGTVFFFLNSERMGGNLYSVLKDFCSEKKDHLLIYMPRKYEEYRKKAYEFGVLYYFPILEKELGGSKKECIKFLSDTLKNKIISKLKSKEAIEEIIELFSESEEDNFLTWYKNKEKEYFSTLDLPIGKYTISDLVELRTTDWCYSIEQDLLDDEFVKLTDEYLTKEYSSRRFYIPNENEFEKKAYQEKFGFKKLIEVMEFLNYIYASDREDFLNWYAEFFPERPSLDKGEKGERRLLRFKTNSDNIYYYFRRIVEEVLYREVPNSIQYESSSVVNIKRLYSMESEDDFAQLLKRYFAAKTVTYKYNPGTFLNKWIKEFEIGDCISIEADSEGLGITLRLHKDGDDEKGSLLADSGYGITQLFAIMLNIEVAILEKEASCCDEPIKTIAIEEPEIHLHPSYQSKLADMFYEAYKDYGIHFIVETHSEYLIRRTQVLVAQMNYASNEEVDGNCPFTTYYVPKNGEPYALGYRKDGKFKKEFGSGFYDEAFNLAFDIL